MGINKHVCVCVHVYNLPYTKDWLGNGATKVCSQGGSTVVPRLRTWPVREVLTKAVTWVLEWISKILPSVVQSDPCGTSAVPCPSWDRICRMSDLTGHQFRTSFHHGEIHTGLQRWWKGSSRGPEFSFQHPHKTAHNFSFKGSNATLLCRCPCLCVPPNIHNQK